jgi:3-oxoacyl-[acyl-carrier-protein] synthase II
MGIVCPLGVGVPSTWQGLVSGRSGVDRLTHFDASEFDVKIAAEVKGFDPLEFMERKQAKHMDRFTHFAVAAGREAVDSSGLRIDDSNRQEIGVIIGSMTGGLGTLGAQFHVLFSRGASRISPFLIPAMIPSMASGQVCMHLGINGPSYCVASACASGAHAIGTAFNIIRQGEAAVMLAGGSEAIITPIAIAGFSAMRALSTRNGEPQKASRPFDAHRDGFVMGEGAGVLVLESLEHALDRGAPIAAEVVGYGATDDAFHITEPDSQGRNMARAMRLAVEQACLKPEDIACINAHGTGTKLNDEIETRAIKSLLGEHAYRVPVTSSKSMLGHTMGAAGAIEALLSVLTIKNGVIPPTINLDSPDPECDLDYVPHVAREREVKTVLSNSFGFGGHNASLLFAAYEG